MELKFPYLVRGAKVYVCSNRTFMELKFVKHRNDTALTVVLIVPLWN